MGLFYKLNNVVTNCENKLTVSHLCNKFIIRNSFAEQLYIIENGIFFFSLEPLRLKKFKVRLKRQKKYFRYCKMLKRVLFLKRFKTKSSVKLLHQGTEKRGLLAHYQDLCSTKASKRNLLFKKAVEILEDEEGVINLKQKNHLLTKQLKNKKKIKELKNNGDIVSKFAMQNFLTGLALKGCAGAFQRKRKRKMKFISFFFKKKLISFLKQRLFLTKLILNLKRNRVPFSGFCKRVVRGGFICKTSFFLLTGFIPRKSVILPFKKQFKLSYFYKLLRFLKLTNSFTNIKALFLIYIFNKKLKFTNFFLISRRYKLQILFPLYVYSFKKTMYKHTKKPGQKFNKLRKKRNRFYRAKKRNKRILRKKRRFFSRSYRIVFVSHLKQTKKSCSFVKKSNFFSGYARLRLKFLFKRINTLKRRMKILKSIKKSQLYSSLNLYTRPKKKTQKDKSFKKKYIKVKIIDSSVLSKKIPALVKKKVPEITKIEINNSLELKIANPEILLKQNKTKPYFKKSKQVLFKQETKNNKYANKKR